MDLLIANPQPGPWIAEFWPPRINLKAEQVTIKAQRTLGIGHDQTYMMDRINPLHQKPSLLTTHYSTTQLLTTRVEPISRLAYTGGLFTDPDFAMALQITPHSAQTLAAMNPNLSRLQPYPFEKLAALMRDIEPAAEIPPISLSIGEPKHATPALISNALVAHIHQLASYPSTRGLLELRQTIADWLCRRFKLGPEAVNPETQILPVNGTREALFAVAQALIDPREAALVLMPNPFYQIYEGATLLAGATPYLLPCTEATQWRPDLEAVPEAVWKRCQLIYICSPGNPTGAVMDQAQLMRLIELAQRHDFIIASDECYAELYLDEASPPPGLLQAAAALGLDDYRRCLCFHSLSKRSNAPGLRSGFVAGDARLIEPFLKYRTYHGCAMPLQHQQASLLAWQDEAHVIENRRLYREKFAAVLKILDGVLEVNAPPAGFYLWPRTPIPDDLFARRLLAEQNLRVLPGRFLSRADDQGDPGLNHIRMALVPPLDDCIEAAQRIRAVCER